MVNAPQDAPKVVSENSGTQSAKLKGEAVKELSGPKQAEKDITESRARIKSHAEHEEGKSNNRKERATIECESIDLYKKQTKALEAVADATKLIAKERTSLGIRDKEYINPTVSEADRAKNYPKQQSILKAIDDLVQTKSPVMTRREAYRRAAEMISKDLAADGLKLDAKNYYYAEEKSASPAKGNESTADDIAKSVNNILRGPGSLSVRMAKELLKPNPEQQVRSRKPRVDFRDGELIGIQFDIIDKKQRKTGTIGVLLLPSHERLRTF